MQIRRRRGGWLIRLIARAAPGRYARPLRTRHIINYQPAKREKSLAAGWCIESESARSIFPLYALRTPHARPPEINEPAPCCFLLIKICCMRDRTVVWRGQNTCRDAFAQICSTPHRPDSLLSAGVEINDAAGCRAQFVCEKWEAPRLICSLVIWIIDFRLNLHRFAHQNVSEQTAHCLKNTTVKIKLFIVYCMVKIFVTWSLSPKEVHWYQGIWIG